MAARVSDAPNDKEQLVPTVQAVPLAIRQQLNAVLADNGFYSAEAVAKVQAGGGPTVYAARDKTAIITASPTWNAAPIRPTHGGG